MDAKELNVKLRECRSELEVRRLVHWHWNSVTGTVREILECLDAANRVADGFAMGEEGSPVEEFEVAGK